MSLIALLSVHLVGLTSVVCAEEPPIDSYRGKSIAGWVELLQSKNESQRKLSYEIFDKIGQDVDAIPALWAGLKSKNPKVRSFSAFYLAKFHKELKAESKRLIECLKLPPGTSTNLMEDVDFRYHIIRLLTKISPVGTDVIPSLIEITKSDNRSAKAAAIYGLGLYKSNDSDVISLLIEQAHGEDVFHARLAVRAFGMLNLNWEIAESHLQKLLTCRNAHVKKEIVSVISTFGLRAGIFKTSLMRIAAEQSHSQLRIRAILALDQVLGTSEELDSFLKTLMQDRDKRVVVQVKKLMDQRATQRK
ncbi:MAG: hypothetical protein QF473_03090 [Planctomycetota bacterium]|jgi:HEAT repeat protein|nr:hypothetical protein [Planctomycetota bacterium]